MTTLKKIFIFSAIVGLMIPAFAFAQFGLKEASEGTDLIKGGQKINAQEEVPALIGSIVAVVLSFLGAIFFLLILYAGFLWMTAFGKAEKADQAKNILEHAIIGLLIVLAAYAISRFVFSSLPGVNSGSSSSGSGASVTSCVDQDNGVNCGDNSVCKSGSCVPECEYAYPAANCFTETQCYSLYASSGLTQTQIKQQYIKTGYCPGGSEIICCLNS